MRTRRLLQKPGSNLRFILKVKLHAHCEWAAQRARGAAGPRTLMASPMCSRTADELLATTGKLCWHVPMLVWNARVRSGDLLSRGARRQHGARVRRVRGVRQLFGASHVA